METFTLKETVRCGIIESLLERKLTNDAAGYKGVHMKQLKISKAFTLIESGPVVLVTTNDGKKDNIMTISWTMVVDFTPIFAITTGEWNYSFTALRKTKECGIAIPTVDMLDKVVGTDVPGPIAANHMTILSKHE
jgi:hypothetical protein